MGNNQIATQHQTKQPREHNRVMGNNQTNNHKSKITTEEKKTVSNPTPNRSQKHNTNRQLSHNKTPKDHLVTLNTQHGKKSTNKQ